MTRTFNSKKYGVITVVSKPYKRTMTWYHVDKPITQDEASIIQLKLGYHPCGYGIYGFATKPDHSTWTRGNSCD